jgi:hypothetical protein
MNRMQPVGPNAMLDGGRSDSEPPELPIRHDAVLSIGQRRDPPIGWSTL